MWFNVMIIKGFRQFLEFFLESFSIKWRHLTAQGRMRKSLLFKFEMKQPLSRVLHFRRLKNPKGEVVYNEQFYSIWDKTVVGFKTLNT